MELYTYHPTIGYTFTPNLKYRMPHESGGYLIRTDSRGFRNSYEVRRDDRGVLVFGDSFTAGDGVSNGKRWTDLIGRYLEGHPICNFGLPASGTDQQYLAWCEFARDLDPALVIIAVLVENIRRNDARFHVIFTEDGGERLKAKPYFDLGPDGTLVPRNIPVPKELREAEIGPGAMDAGGRFALGRRLVNSLGLRDQVQRLLHYQPLPEYGSADQPSWRRTRAILEKWVREVEAPCIVLPIPIHQYVEETADARACQERFAEFSRDTGVPVVDPLPALLRYGTQERRAFRFEQDVHFTEAGHKALAEAVGPEIRRILPGGR